MKRRKRASALIALAVLGSLFVPGSADAADTLTVQVAQEFFSKGIPGFSGRVYPGSVKVHSGDTIHFTDRIVLFPEGVYPQDYIPENVWTVDGAFSFLRSDPDEGPNALKIQEEATTDCGSQANPCVWDGKGDLIFPAFPEEVEGQEPDYSLWVTVEAPAGTTLWGTTLASSEVNTNVEVEVVAPNEAASTQEGLDARAAELMNKDYEDAAALHKRMNAKRTVHRNAAGQKVFDVFVGAAAGPIELFASYPRRISVPRGARVMYHFMDENEPHTATFGGPKARNLMQNAFMPVCDPDGDQGTAPDTAPNFSDPAAPPCEPPAELEIDLDSRVVEEVGDGRVTGASDLENSGLKAPIFPEETSFDSNPWTVRMTKSSTVKGFKYVCLVHGGFMGGRVVVR